ncbi:hypothetical protein U0070_024321 [Myodes glareolus]|uniref:Uncharacterized protein n=1 Tax=Myodes glareolus TaxID=447135 RepID=A0AAW0ILJ0_MYOGA
MSPKSSQYFLPCGKFKFLPTPSRSRKEEQLQPHSMEEIVPANRQVIKKLSLYDTEKRRVIIRRERFKAMCKLPHFSVDTRTSKQARAFPDSSPRERTHVLGVKTHDTHTKRPGSSAKEQVANGSFIKHKSGIYTVGQKDTSPPSGTRKEKSQGAAPKVREQLNREKRKPGGRAQAQRKADPGTLPAGENLACRHTYRALSLHSPTFTPPVNGPILQNHSCRNSMTQENIWISERSFGEGPELMVCQKPEAPNLNNNTLHNERLQVKLFGQEVQEGECPDRLDPQNPVYAEETRPSVIVNGVSERLRASYIQRIRPHSENLDGSRPCSVPVQLALCMSVEDKMERLWRFKLQGVGNPRKIQFMSPHARICTLLQAGLLFRSQSHLHNIGDSILSQDTGDTEEDIILDSIETLNHGGNGVHPPQILHYALCQVSHREANGPGRITFQLDHLIGAVNHLLVNLLPLLLVCIGAQIWVQILQGDTSDIHTTPHRHTGVPIESTLSLLLTGPRGDDDQLGVGSQAIVFARDNFRCSKEKAAVLKIHHLSLQFVFHDINKGKLIRQLLGPVVHDEQLRAHSSVKKLVCKEGQNSSSGDGWRYRRRPTLEHRTEPPKVQMRSRRTEKMTKDCEECDHPLIQGVGSNESLPRAVGLRLNEHVIQPDSLNVAGFSELSHLEAKSSYVVSCKKQKYEEHLLKRSRKGESPNRLERQNPVYAEEASLSVIVNGFSKRLRGSHIQRIWLDHDLVQSQSNRPWSVALGSDTSTSCLIDTGHSNVYEEVSHCTLDLHFSNNYDDEYEYKYMIDSIGSNTAKSLLPDEHVQKGEYPNRLDPKNPVYAEETSPSVIVNGFSERLWASHIQRIRIHSENLVGSRPRSVPVQLALGMKDTIQDWNSSAKLMSTRVELIVTMDHLKEDSKSSKFSCKIQRQFSGQYGGLGFQSPPAIQGLCACAALGLLAARLPVSRCAAPPVPGQEVAAPPPGAPAFPAGLA